MAWKRKSEDSSVVDPTSEKEARKKAAREKNGREARRYWLAIQSARRAAGQNVGEVDLRPWDELSDSEREVFCRGAESITIPEATMWAAVAEQRKLMGEKAFRAKMFEMSIDIIVDRMCPNQSEAERYRAVNQIVKLAGMLEVPSGAVSPRQLMPEESP